MKKYVIRKIVVNFVDYEIVADTEKEAFYKVSLEDGGKQIRSGLKKESFEVLTPDYPAEV